jgi:hypothetical protein
MNCSLGVKRKALDGTAIMSVLSQMIPANVRLIKFVLADFVKLPL